MKRMIPLPPFDNNSYVWQGKGWKKINIYSDSNLAAPNLTGKTYLGDGVYRIYNANGITIDYNVLDGIFTFNGTTTTNFNTSLGSTIQENGTYALNFAKLGGSISKDYQYAPRVGGALNRNIFNSTTSLLQTLSMVATDNILRFNFSNETVFTNYIIKIQLIAGSTQRPYIPPAAHVKYYLEHDYEPLTIEGLVNFENKIFNDFSQLKENIE